MSRPSRPPPPPLEGRDQVITGSITACWAVALILLLALRSRLPAADHWWLGTCVFGTALGVFGLVYVPYLKRSRERARERRAGAREPQLPGAGIE